MKRYIKTGMITLFALLLLFGGLSLHTVVQSQHYSRLINYVGIVRGASQRLVKLELMGQQDDAMIQYLDDIILELTTGSGKYGLPMPDDRDYQQKLNLLNDMWQELKAQIQEYRSGVDCQKELLELSEHYFELANETVFAVDHYAAKRIHTLLIMNTAMFLTILLSCLLVLWAYWKKLLGLETTNQQLQDLTRRDKLTGVYQLEAFKEEATRLLKQNSGEKMAIVYTDFTDFKYINDVFGYAFGDSVLRKYGEILRCSIGKGELCGRVSADNFVLLLRYREREEVAARQRAADEEIIRYMHTSHSWQSVPTCCGICCIQDVVETLNIDGFMDRANFARKTVKNGTNANYVYYDESIRRRLREEKDVESRMLSALEKREFTVYYQPKVELKTGRIVGAESLVRWKSENGTIIPPDCFIPVFERKYMIDRLDQYVFQEVCRFLSGQIKAGKPVVPISVNVSRLQFYDQNFVKHYAETRDRYKIPPGLLEIEFTESIAIDNAGLLTSIVEQLRQAGFACSIDDFGKGYSSLSLLKSLPVDVLKIDSFFFAESNDPERDMDVVQGIVELVHKFHIRTVAEGVESQEQVEKLKQIGCDYVQGYAFYRPMPGQEYEVLLEEQEGAFQKRNNSDTENNSDS